MTPERATTISPGSTARRRAAKIPSAGLPVDEAGSADDRLVELENRLARLERSAGLRERGRDMMARVAPAEAGHHFRNAGREHLLGIRSIVDFWIGRIELAEERAGEPADAPAAGPTTITVD